MHRTVRTAPRAAAPRAALGAAIAIACLAAACSSHKEAPPAGIAEEAARTRAQARAEADASAQTRELHSLQVTASRAPTSMPAPPPPVVFDEPSPVHGLGMPPVANTENYDEIEDNPVHRTVEAPVSTFSIDVDTGSYTNVRAMLDDGIRPPADAVRAEEFLNYFDYGHPAPSDRAQPFRVTTELAPAPWNGKRQLLMIGIKGYEVPKAELPPANLVFLIDSSGSMGMPDKLPLLKRAFSLLVRELRPQDRVSIVVYAGSAGLVLPPTPGDRQGEILAALERLEAGGSTNGGEGIQLAYAMARQGYVEGGVNRVILATDGDFNVGTVDQGALETLVADQRASGIALSTLGFGRGNYNDAMAEQLANVGNGNHAYIDNVHEARKVLVEEMGSTLMTIASDVKIQVEFNPARVAEYRLIGYENRILAREDFDNDRVDAGEIGAGHEVTALYEITPPGSGVERLPPLRYGEPARPGTLQGEVAHLRLRYKVPGRSDSTLLETPVNAASARAEASDSLRFAASVAGFADLLRGGSRFDGWDWQAVLATARGARGEDPRGERAAFVGLVETAGTLVPPASGGHAAISE
ncbi:VWA domain-containing protein [Lysobacter sp. SG-8]|uniref:VWA domain-containing protein n=1 Tax=Marilutibacter penaei TaxID=2759900 RepID=A0A7W3U4U1_9GAMM|nr:VWA domain-containing protein [Lysobacter penaei]MBB1088999.1 VWA domain-containing protein [Lysobacter penaei]